MKKNPELGIHGSQVELARAAGHGGKGKPASRIRPEAVKRARRLAADPLYPSTEVLRKVAESMLCGSDLAEE